MAENISATVLFHFTRSIDNLESILRKGFFPRYCLEYSLNPGDRELAQQGKPPSYASPMVCFCDLPMSLIREHMRRYGHFGIGLKKSWGIKYGVTPVIYTHETAATRQERKNVLRAYTKPFSGFEWRGGHVTGDVDFYDEREWRYIPPALKGAPLFLRRKDFAEDCKKQKLENELKKTNRLPIHPDDIQYLILPFEEDENNVVSLHNFLKTRYKTRDAILVTTTIMTENCIQEDM